MSPLSEVIRETLSEQIPFSDEEWVQTPKAVQEFALSLIVRVQALEAEVVDLREQLNRNSRNSSKPPSSDRPQAPPKPRRRAKSGRKRGAQPGHKGTTRKLVPIEQVKESHDVKPDVCCRCECALVGKDPEPHRHQVTEIPPMVAQVTEYRIHTLTCSECKVKTRAKLPIGVSQGAFGPRLQSMVSLLSGRYHLSKRDIVDIMSDFFQANVSLGSVSALERRTSKVIRVPVDEAREYVKTQPVVHMDETGWRESNQKAWMWVAATNLVTVFLIRQSRGGKVAREMLDKAFKGIVVSDRWSAYNWLLTILRQLCWAHLLRNFQAFVDRGGESQIIGTAILAQSNSMF